ncbi:N-acetylmuramoyl-L-alanine amidase [Fusibacter sp. 3D3]|uniref:N-acetylmuramoyl-L-alanine amidase n=1 Tax=Fusibacter sp. 3D3 TaxID=1048380 RepID=UPI00158676E9|nr:N-acetylmuramoyl-L-alanine amidase [Fusibacter sp. 3D3]
MRNLKLKKMSVLMLVVAILGSMMPLTFANKYFESDQVELVDPISGTSGSYYPVNIMFAGEDVITDVPAIVYEKNGSSRTIVPISFITEKLGAQISWKQETQEVTIVSAEKTIVMQIGNANATVNGKQTKLPDGIPPILLQYEGKTKTYVPVNFISSQLGLDVSWIAGTRTVAINRPVQTLTDINLDYMKQFPEIRMKVTGEVVATSFNISGADVGAQDKIIIDLQNTKFDLKDKSLLKDGIGTYRVTDGIFGIDKVEISSQSSNPPTTRVVVYLDQKKGHNIFFDEKTGEMVIQLVNTVNNVSVDKIYSTDTVVIDTSEDPIYNINVVGNQIMVDVINSYMKINAGQMQVVPVDQGKIASLGYSQLDTSKYTDSDFYTSEDKVSRVIIELNEKVTHDDIYVENDGTQILVFVSQNPLNNFDYVKLNNSRSTLDVRLLKAGNYDIAYNKETRVLRVEIPKALSDLSAFEYPVRDQLLEAIEMKVSGDQYQMDITLSPNTTYQQNTVDGKISFAFSNTAIQNSIYKDMLIVLDAGHGGHDSGATGTQAKEKDLALKATLLLENQLKSLGFKVYLTRSTDEYIGLYDRADIANDLNADLFVSIHINATTNSTASGVEVLYASDSMSGGKGLADLIQKQLVSTLGAKNRGIVKRPNLVVIRETKMPSVLCELGFISNPEEQDKMMTTAYLEKAAKAIVEGIKQFIK